ncbi:MAG: protein kinase [Actinomycetota bacterium]|nr:protein kinase [Actinomycetota bacterium]
MTTIYELSIDIVMVVVLLVGVLAVTGVALAPVTDAIVALWDVAIGAVSTLLDIVSTVIESARRHVRAGRQEGQTMLGPGWLVWLIVGPLVLLPVVVAATVAEYAFVRLAVQYIGLTGEIGVAGLHADSLASLALVGITLFFGILFFHRGERHGFGPWSGEDAGESPTRTRGRQLAISAMCLGGALIGAYLLADLAQLRGLVLSRGMSGPEAEAIRVVNIGLAVLLALALFVGHWVLYFSIGSLILLVLTVSQIALWAVGTPLVGLRSLIDTAIAPFGRQLLVSSSIIGLKVLNSVQRVRGAPELIVPGHATRAPSWPVGSPLGDIPPRGPEVLSGRWELGEFLPSRGSWATVRYATDRTKKYSGLAVVKLVASFTETRPWAIAEETEIYERLRELDSEHIVRLLDSGYDYEGQRWFLVTEYAIGGDLRQYVERYRLNDVVQFYDICEAVLMGLLDAIVGAGLQGHFDIRDHNIVVALEGTERTPIIKLIDFGISIRSDATSTGGRAHVGTEWHRAPEQNITGHPLDASADLYSIAVLLYQLASGRPPFQREAEAEQLSYTAMYQRHIRNGVLPIRLDVLNPGVHSTMADLVERWLSVDPTERQPGQFGSEAIVRAALNEFRGARRSEEVLS